MADKTMHTTLKPIILILALSTLLSSATSYLFEEKWELVPGKFKFEVWHGDEKICEQSFMVVPDAKPKDKP
jgi:hypothetical protein